MIFNRLPAGIADALAEQANQIGPVGCSIDIDGDAVKAHGGQHAVIQRHGALIGYRDQGYRFLARLANVAALRHTRHHHGGLTLMDGAQVDMAQGPIAVARAMQIDHGAGGINVVAHAAVQAGMHQADVERAGNGGGIVRQQAFGRVRFGEAEAVDRNRQHAVDHLGIGLGAEHGDRGGEHQFAGDLGQRIMVAPNDEGGDARRIKALQFLLQKAGGFHRHLIAVIQIARNQQGIDPFGDAQIDDPGQGITRGNADQRLQRRVTQRQRAQRAVKVQVCGMDKTEGHG